MTPVELAALLAVVVVLASMISVEIGISVAVIVVLPKIAPWFFGRGHAVLPAFVVGLVMSRHNQSHLQEQERLRVVAFAFLTPFFFLRGGMNVSLEAIAANVGVLALLVAAKIGLVMPLARRYIPEHATFTTLLMSTGLTFGTISSSW